MKEGFLFIAALFGFFFVLWLLGNGPNQPISHQGVFITPATTTNAAQHGYGPKPGFHENISLPGGGNISAESGPSIQSNTTADTPAILMAQSNRRSDNNPDQKYLEFTLLSNSARSVNIKGWKFVSQNLHSYATISSDIVLKPEQSVLVVTSFLNTGAHDTMRLVDPNGNVIAGASY